MFSDQRKINAIHGQIVLGILTVKDIKVVFVMIALTVFSRDEQSSLEQEILTVFLKG
ncbi:MAG: hypothetical protein ACTMUB_02885 [cyanobacterium endosymbiont of Rhopalodia musculus]|uniref:hypothetical protein n=1 Tax=cyanobacterium endosymbiont of Epithemia clementina EcSB TaxID=3034674 RepID=UPI002480242A|nr:hypothetical protein [cyanobacterium endosymbiont of Epithemia clementina EcSB]WGT67163.1 hypothetical protein P3F56_08050 [cyanobacterium endosymbiont of Epithemia clementina EcSB]